MAKIMNHLAEKKNRIVFATKVVLMVYAMLISIPAVHHYLYFTKKLVCAWTLLLAAYLLLTDRPHYRKKEYWAMALFSLSYGVTILLHINTYLINEVLIWGYLVSTYFMMTYCDKELSSEQVYKEYRTMAAAVVVVSFVFALINLGIYFAVYPGTAHMKTGSFFYGINGGQLGGIYNPNTGGCISYISIIFSLFLLPSVRKSKAFLIINMFVQLWSLSLVQSRGTWICILAFFVLYFLFVWDRPSLKRGKRIACKLGLMVACIVLVTGASKLIRTGSIAVAEQLQINEIIDSHDNHVPIPSERDMHNSTNSNFTTGRAELWAVGLEKVAESPVFGIGYRNIDDAIKSELSAHDYNNSAAGGLHNVYLTVLVSSGVAGFTCFAVLILFLLWKILKIYRSRTAPVYIKYLATCLLVWLVGDLVESRIILSLSFMSVCFWITAGYILNYSEECEKIDQCDHSGL